MPIWKRRWFQITFKILVVVVVLAFLSRTLSSALARLQQEHYQWGQLRWAWLAASGGYYLAAMLPMMLFWQRVLTALGQPTEPFNLLYAYCTGHLGKYVPGKAMVVMIRVGLLRTPAIPLVALAASVVIETLTMMSVGALLAALFLLVHAHEQWKMLLLACGLLAVAGIPTLPPVFRAVVLRTARSPLDREQLSGVLPRINFRLLGIGWALNTLAWLLMGLSLWSVVVAVAPEGDIPSGWTTLPQWVAWSSLSMVAGFLSLLPGGVLVRDGVLIELLHGTLDPVRAIVAALLLRIVWVVVEVGVVGLLHLAARLLRLTTDRPER